MQNFALAKILSVNTLSAGIGRTGVFMLTETALCKMEALEPIYPLEIVWAMRDQRGMLVQTPVSAVQYNNTYILGI